MTWQRKKLGEVCDFKVKRNVKFLPYVGMEDVEGETGRFLGSLENREMKSATAYFDTDCVLYGKLRPYLNKVLVPNFEGHCSTEFVPLRVDKKLLNRAWIAIFLRSKEIVKKISKNVTGSRMPRASLEFMKNLEIPLPPLEEQKRIVEKLERVLGEMQNAKRINEEALSDIDQILPAELSKIFAEGKEKGWEERELGDMCETRKNINPKELFESDFIYVDIKSVDAKEKRIQNAKKISLKEAPGRARKSLLEGDSIFATTRPYLENIAYIDEKYSNAIASTGFCVLSPRKNNLNGRYLFYIISSKIFIKNIISKQKGGSYPAVSDQDIYKEVIPLPSLSEQKEIVDRLNAISKKVKKLRELHIQNTHSLTSLEQSILSQAFQED